MANILKKIDAAYKVHQAAKSPKVRAAAIAALVGAPVATGVVSYQAGKKKGATHTANIMASEFMRRNALENEQIAQHFFHKGVQYKQGKKGVNMNKKAALDEVYDASFSDEMEKIAKTPLLAKLIGKQRLKSLSKFYKRMGTKEPSVTDVTTDQIRKGLEWIKKNKHISVPAGTGVAGFAAGKILSD